MIAVAAAGLGKRYGRTWALRDCTLTIPGGHVVALAGPNGAGKTTLLHLAVGLAAPTCGRIAVLDGLAAGSAPALERVGFVAQDAALYAGLTVADTLRLTRDLNRRWDEGWARRRMAELDIPLDRKIGKLSGGPHAQVALAAVLAKRPELVVLDEPVARLDPLARHEFMAALMAAVADEGLSVVFSSHVVAELERVCDYLIVLTQGHVQVAGDVDDLLGGHRVLVGPVADRQRVEDRYPVVRESLAERQAHLLVRVNGRRPDAPPTGWDEQAVTLEELVLTYLRDPAARALPGPASLGEPWHEVAS
ncbi:MAG: ABC transporter ATP-binding protein [Thermoleophilia bacterium]